MLDCNNPIKTPWTRRYDTGVRQTYALKLVSPSVSALSTYSLFFRKQSGIYVGRKELLLQKHTAFILSNLRVSQERPTVTLTSELLFSKTQSDPETTLIPI